MNLVSSNKGWACAICDHRDSKYRAARWRATSHRLHPIWRFSRPPRASSWTSWYPPSQQLRCSAQTGARYATYATPSN